jgi:phosphonate transport system permease protein
MNSPLPDTAPGRVSSPSPHPSGTTPPPVQLPPPPPWHSRFNVMHITLFAFLLACGWAITSLEGPSRRLDYWGNLKRFVGYFLPPDFSESASILRALAETAQIALLATAVATVIAFPLGAMGARTLMPMPIAAAARLLLSAIRTIPSLIWALIAVAVVGPGPLAGVWGLAAYSLGYLGKFFADALESVDIEVARGLRAIGAGRMQAFQYGVWPAARPLLWSYVLWMLEYNLRSAAIIGYVGAGGLGVQLAAYQEYYQWEKFAAVLVYIFALVVILDFAGERVRLKVTRRVTKSLSST